IRRAFELCLARAPGEAELKRLLALHAGQVDLLRKTPGSAAKILGETDVAVADLEDKAALVAVCRIVMNLDEFLTRE
ncbi:MAG: hypothetical protein V4773_01695, partial [Verrucomicrobiota bacterium]